MFTPAARRNENVRPRSPMSQNPASSVPAIAPAVFVAYSRLTRSPSRPERTRAERTTMGRLAPMSVAGTNNTVNDKTKRTTVSKPTESGRKPACRHTRVRRRPARSSSRGRRPRRGSRRSRTTAAVGAARSTNRPATKLPSASPAKKLASTVETAYTVTPKTSDSWRTQSCWYTRPHAPVPKKRRSSVGNKPRPEPRRRGMPDRSSSSPVTGAATTTSWAMRAACYSPRSPCHSMQSPAPPA